MKRLFIAINLPPHLKEIIAKSVNNKLISIRCGGLPDEAKDFRWLSPENWHLTLVFLGYQPDEKIPNILESVKTTTQSLISSKRPILVEFEKIIWAPPDKPARMIWLCGTKETSESLGEIKNYLEDSLVKNGVRFRIENRPYNAHLTLARFNFIKSDLRKEVGLPNIENLSFTAQSLDLMESQLKRTGAEYEILTRMDFLK